MKIWNKLKNIQTKHVADMKGIVPNTNKYTDEELDEKSIAVIKVNNINTENKSDYLQL